MRIDGVGGIGIIAGMVHNVAHTGCFVLIVISNHQVTLALFQMVIGSVRVLRIAGQEGVNIVITHYVVVSLITVCQCPAGPVQDDLAATLDNLREAFNHLICKKVELFLVPFCQRSIKGEVLGRLSVVTASVCALDILLDHAGDIVIDIYRLH